MPRDGKTNRSGQATILEPEEMSQLFAELDDPYRAIAQLCYFTAGRISEVLQLRAENILNNRILFEASTTKEKQTRSVVISEPMRRVLERVKPGSGYLFPSSSQTGHLTARAVEKRVKLAAALLGFDGVSLHTFRRSRLTHLHEQGWGLHELSKVSGHASLAQLQKYLGVDQAAVDGKLVAVDAGWV